MFSLFPSIVHSAGILPSLEETEAIGHNKTMILVELLGRFHWLLMMALVIQVHELGYTSWTFIYPYDPCQREAIQFSVLHLDGVAYDWWHHGLVTQDHVLIHSYAEFTEWLIYWFDRKDT